MDRDIDYIVQKSSHPDATEAVTMKISCNVNPAFRKTISISNGPCIHSEEASWSPCFVNVNEFDTFGNYSKWNRFDGFLVQHLECRQDGFSGCRILRT